jgi:hypothetical protein
MVRRPPQAEANSSALSLESLGVVPCARAAARSKRQLGRYTLDSTTAILSGLTKHGVGTGAAR